MNTGFDVFIESPLGSLDISKIKRYVNEKLSGEIVIHSEDIQNSRIDVAALSGLVSAI